MTGVRPQAQAAEGPEAGLRMIEPICKTIADLRSAAEDWVGLATTDRALEQRFSLRIEDDIDGIAEVACQ